MVMSAHQLHRHLADLPRYAPVDWEIEAKRTIFAFLESNLRFGSDVDPNPRTIAYVADQPRGDVYTGMYDGSSPSGRLAQAIARYADATDPGMKPTLRTALAVAVDKLLRADRETALPIFLALGELSPEPKRLGAWQRAEQAAAPIDAFERP